jgi:malate permease and related proteins
VELIASAIVPVFVVAAIGYAAGKLLDLHVRTLAALNIYLFIPSLVFRHLSQNAIAWNVFGRIALACVATELALYVVLRLVARARRMSGAAESAFLMTLFPNLGNFGLPVCLFAFGEEGLFYAVVVMVCGSFLQNSVGIYFAERSRLSGPRAFLRVFEFPMIYAFILALIFQQGGWKMPDALFRPVSLLADAAIPIQLVILGAQLAATRLRAGVDVLLASAIRLAASPAVALAIAVALGLSGLPAKVFVLQFSAPVAVGMAVFGVQFDVKPGFIASVVAVTFLCSLATVSLVLLLLAGAPL